MLQELNLCHLMLQRSTCAAFPHDGVAVWPRLVLGLLLLLLRAQPLALLSCVLRLVRYTPCLPQVAVQPPLPQPAAVWAQARTLTGTLQRLPQG